MPKYQVSAKTAFVSDANAGLVAGLAVLVSSFSFLYYFQHHDLLLYGDAVAHINIARRVFDSETPGLLQLGTVWLPLPHLLMIPFLLSDGMWQSGAGASIPSMVAYVLGVSGIFRLVRGMLEADPRTKDVAGPSALVAAFAYGANPNLIYVQTTALSEPVYLAFSIWTVVYFTEFIRTLRKSEEPDDLLLPPTHPSLLRCGCCVAGAELTRYDGWVLACFAGILVALVAVRRWNDAALRRVAARFLVGIAIVPALWLTYNRLVFGSALAFVNGPYSAKAIEQRVGAPNPALNNAPVAAMYFLKAAQLNMADGNWGRFWLGAALVVLAIAVWKLRVQLPALLFLWIPLAFYAASIAYGSVPLHVQTWWPFEPFNQRYGLELLPLFAVSAGLLIASVYFLGIHTRHARKVALLVLVLIAASYAFVWKSEPQCFQEAWRNWAIRNPLNSSVEAVVARLPPDSRFLMDISEHVGVMQQLGIPLRRVINNEDHRPWKHPSDPEGLWERALADPSRYVDFVIVFDGDAVDGALNRINLSEVAEIHATGQPRAHIYAVRLRHGLYNGDTNGSGALYNLSRGDAVNVIFNLWERTIDRWLAPANPVRSCRSTDPEAAMLSGKIADISTAQSIVTAAAEPDSSHCSD